MPRLAVHDPKGSCKPKRPAPSLCTARVYGGRIPRSLVHTRSRAARQRPMQGGALHHPPEIFGYFVHLAVIHAAPKWLWSALVEAVTAGDGLSVKRLELEHLSVSEE